MRSGNSDSAEQLAGIVLAAGASTRFGSPKQAADIGGESMIALAVRRAVAQCTAGVVVVAGAHYDELAPLLDNLPARVIRNRQWREGMGSSIRAGLAETPKDSLGVLLMLCDQPGVTAVDLNRLASAWRREPEQIAAARYDNSLGVPAIFPQRYRQPLLDLGGAAGAKQIIISAHSVSAVDMPTAALDVDTPAQLERFSG